MVEKYTVEELKALIDKIIAQQFKVTERSEYEVIVSEYANQGITVLLKSNDLEIRKVNDNIIKRKSAMVLHDNKEIFEYFTLNEQEEGIYKLSIYYKNTEFLKNYNSELFNRENKVDLFVNGTVGSGKKELVRHLVLQSGYSENEMLYIVRKKDLPLNYTNDYVLLEAPVKLGTATFKQNLFGTLEENPQIKLIIFDDVLSDDYNKSLGLVTSLRKYNEAFQFIFSTNVNFNGVTTKINSFEKMGFTNLSLRVSHNIYYYTTNDGKYYPYIQNMPIVTYSGEPFNFAYEKLYVPTQKQELLEELNNLQNNFNEQIKLMRDKIEHLD